MICTQRDLQIGRASVYDGEDEPSIRSLRPTRRGSSHLSRVLHVVLLAYEARSEHHQRHNSFAHSRASSERQSSSISRGGLARNPFSRFLAMPLTPFQKDVLRLLAANRSAGSHLGGGVAINRDDLSPRFSEDLDLFHDVADAVATSAMRDEQVLQGSGFTVDWLIRQPSMHRAEVRRGKEQVRLDWCFDSAFRFFPVQPDPEFGFVLHRADLATNKLLALAGRSEIRDFIDILHLHRTELSLGALAWAACGKDEGFNPASLLAMAKRHVRFRQEDLDQERLREPLDLQALKSEWIDAVDAAEKLITDLPPAEVGCLYLSLGGSPTSPDPASPGFPSLIRHFGSLHGAWPTIARS